MEWAEIGKQGILFQPGKTLESTGVEVLIRLDATVERLVTRLRAFPNVNMRHVFCKQDGQRYTYSGASTAWKARHPAGGDTEHAVPGLAGQSPDGRGRKKRNYCCARMGAHSTQAQTAAYVVQSSNDSDRWQPDET